MKRYFIGIDIGTGSTKAVALDTEGRNLGTSQVPYPTYSKAVGYSEQDPETIWQAFIQCLKEVISLVPGKPQAVALSSAMHSLTAVDNDGRPLMSLITWADSRATKIAEKLKASSVGEVLYGNTGTPVHSISLLPKIIWIAENEPEVFSNTLKFISIKEYIWFKLFGDYQVDHSIASASGLFNISDLDWDPLALDLAGISAAKLSSPVPTNFFRSDVLRDVSEQCKFDDRVNFVIGASDGCLANLGSFALEPGRAAVTIGTSGAVRIRSPKPILNFQAMTFNYLLDDESFICGGPINNGGLSVDWLIKNFLGSGTIAPKDFTMLFEKVSGVPAGSSGLVFLPYLIGERAPIWDTQATGNFFGVRNGHTQAHFCRAVLEGVCFAIKQVLEIVEQEKQEIQQIQVGGGFTGSDLWMQMLADITGKRVFVIQTSDASAIGAVYLAMKALDAISHYSALHEPDGRQFLPDENVREIYQRNYFIFKKLYPALKELMHS